MTDLDHVAVLRNTRCGHVAAIVRPERVGVLYRRLVAINRPGWQVVIERNTPAVYDDFTKGRCPQCQNNL